MNPWFWAIGSIVVAIAEMHSPGCYLIWLAAGGLITSLLSVLFDLSFTTQLSTLLFPALAELDR